MPDSPPLSPDETRPIDVIRRVGAARAALAIAGFLVVTVFAAAFAGYRAGVQKNVSLSATEIAGEAARQYDLGLQDMADGHLLTASERFRYVLSLEPAHPDVTAKLAEVEGYLRQTAAAPSPRPAAATQTATDSEAAPGDLLSRADSALQAGHWDAALSTLLQLQGIYPDFAADRVRDDFYRTYRGRGLERITAARLQEGIFDLNRAESYGKLDNEAEAQRLWATQYVRGSALWGADWPATIVIFEDLYRAAPYFHDTISRLHGAHVAYGDQLWARGDPCSAMEQYGRAVEVLPDSAVEDKRQAAEAACAAGTPTPEAPQATDTPRP